MSASSIMRYASVAAIGVCMAAALWGGALLTAEPARGDYTVPQGQHGYVVSHIAFALAPDASATGACPNGMTSGYPRGDEVFVGASADLAQRSDEPEDQYIRRLFTTAMTDPNVRNLCLNPELGRPNPSFKTVVGSNLQVEGLDLDGRGSDAASCRQADFRGGVDNQFYRLVGCSNSYQSTGPSNTWDIEMLTGSWGVLISLDGVDDIRNDPNVTVTFQANADPIQLSPGRQPLRNATYAAEQNPAYTAQARGRIVNGVLTTEPVDMQWHWIVNSIRLDRILKHARVRLTFQEDGSLDGFLGGYTPVEAAYDANYGFRNGRDGAGEPSPLRLRTVSSIGQARVLGHTCEGAYYAMHALADGDRDPATGDCTSISTQYRIRAIPAYVVQQQSQSVNEDLAHTNDPNDTRARNGY